jgi:hypothetical protein
MMKMTALFVVLLGITAAAYADYSDDELIRILDQNFERVHQQVDEEIGQLLETLSHYDNYEAEKAMVEEVVRKQFEQLNMAREMYKFLMPSMDALYQDKLHQADERKSQLEKDYAERMIEISQKMEDMKSTVVDLPSGTDCVTSDDCMERFTCQPIQEHLRTYLNESGQSERFDEYSQQLNITGSECVLDLRIVLDQADPFELISRLDGLRNKVVEDMSGFQEKMKEFGINVDLSFMDQATDVTFGSSSMQLKPHEMYLMERGQTELNPDQMLIMMMPNANPLTNYMAVAAKSKSNENASQLEKVRMVYNVIEDVHATRDPAPRSGADTRAADIDPITLMILMGDGELDTLSLLALTGGLGDLDPITVMLLLGDGNIDTLSLLALTDGIGGDNGIDLTTLLLLTKGDTEDPLDPITMLALTGSMDSLNPLTLRLLMGDSVDTLTLLVLSGGLGDVSPLTVMLLSAEDQLDSLALLALTGGLSGDLDPMTLMLLNDDSVDPLVLLAVTGGLEGLDPLALKLLMGEEVDQLSALALTGILGDLDLITMMLLMDQDLDALTLAAITGGLEDISPVTLMLLLGNDLDTMTLLALTGSLGEMDAVTTMLLLGDEDIDPLTLMALTGNTGEGSLDPLTLLLLTQGEGDLDPLMLLALTGGLGDMNPALILLLLDQELDALSLLALTGGLGDVDSTTLMLLLMQDGGDSDLLTLLALTGGLGDIDATTMALLLGSDMDMMTLLAVTGAFGEDVNPALLLLMNQSEGDNMMEMLVLSQMMK